MISIVLPTYERGYCIGNTISSVINQTYKDWELIIIDNNSSDNTVDIVNEFNDSRIRLYCIDNQGVIAKSRNYGIALSTGSHIAFIDSDDPWVCEKLSIVERYLCQGYDFVYHDLMRYDGKDISKNCAMNLAKSLKKPVFVDLIANGNRIPTSSVVVKKKLITAVGGFSEEKSLIGAEDYDLWVRISRVYDGFFMLERRLGYYASDGSGTLNKSLRSRSLNGLRILHKEFHAECCGKTPDWLATAWCRTLIPDNSRKAIVYSLKYLKERRSVKARLKLVFIACAGAVVVLFERVLTKN